MIMVNLGTWGRLGPKGPTKTKFLQKVNSSFSQEFQNEKISASYFEIVNMKEISGISIKIISPTVTWLKIVHTEFQCLTKDL